MATASEQKLRAVKTIEQLIDYLRDELGWPIDVEDVDDAFFTWDADELGLDASTVAKVQRIRQLRPVVRNQPWGIFFVDFERKRLPIVALRRVLSSLVVKRRAAGRRDRQRWQTRDLLFISALGPHDEREIVFAHFTDESEHGDLPTLRVLGWDDADTSMKLEHVARTLHESMLWPADEANLDAWRASWRKAFAYGYRQAINSARDLSHRLAELALRVRKRVSTVLVHEAESGPLRTLYRAFKDALIHDLSPDDFADTFAQTITYGLFAARVQRPSGLVADDVALIVPNTNPFLHGLLQEFLAASGRARRRAQRVDFDELGINEVVETLRLAPMAAVLREFDNANRDEDPVIHFYEDFLKAYDRQKWKERGVFYTPKPVVRFIVRSVDEMLRTEFGLADGLADTATWQQVQQRAQAAGQTDFRIPAGVAPDSPFVTVLDPALGTATFLVEVIEVIYRTMRAKWQAAGRTREQIDALWADYVPAHLLPRLFGFELMMAPYAIAHVKLALKLTNDTGYRFPAEPPRVNVFLTNTLEPAQPVQPQLASLAPMLADEARAANRVKESLAPTVVLGNPPYAGHSINNNIPEIVQQVYDYKRGYPDLAKPGQAKWLQNDYVKFLRFGEGRIGRAERGILAFITDHSYLDNPTFKGMRRHLLDTFGQVRIIDLHGNAKKKERAPDGGADQNVFEITQGAAIGLFARRGASTGCSFAEVWGPRAVKFERLLQLELTGPAWRPMTPNAPFHLFRPQDDSLRAEYEMGWPLPMIFNQNGDPAPGIVTTHDEFAISWTPEEAAQKVERFLATRNEKEARQLWQLCTQSQWNYERAKRELADGKWRRKIVPILYRPFDVRYTVYDSNVAVHRRDRVMGALLSGDNVALITARSNKSQAMDHVELVPEKWTPRSLVV